MMFELIQLISGLIFCYSYLPQIFTIYKNKSAKDVSLGMYVLCAVGSFLFEIYVFYLIFTFGTGYIMLLTNTIGFLLSSITIYLIKKYKK